MVLLLHYIQSYLEKIRFRLDGQVHILPCRYVLKMYRTGSRIPLIIPPEIITTPTLYTLALIIVLQQ